MTDIHKDVPDGNGAGTGGLGTDGAGTGGLGTDGARATQRPGSVPLSVLDLVPISEGATATDALQTMVKLARLAERVGYKRFWVAEHHSMPNIASSAPEVLIAHVAGATETIRVGAGGIMLPNHVPLKVAEAFHTLQALHPGRIDLGIGRAPGTDPAASAALRPFKPDQFPSQLQELIALSEGAFPEGHPFHTVRVVPEDVQLPPIWMLGSSGASAKLAGTFGLGYSFASHFSHTSPVPALEAYRQNFKPAEGAGGAAFTEPHVILGLAIICAPTDEEADFLAKTMDLMWVRMQKNERGRLPSPEEAVAYEYSPREQLVVDQYRRLAIIGSPETVRQRIDEVVRQTQADEIIVSTIMFNDEQRLRSYELIAEAYL